MLLAYLTLFSGLFISAVAIYYSVSGLTAIFAASVIPIIIMGTSLEVGKLVASVWLKQNWSRAPKLLRGYLISAVAILMLITSMGIFGYLSKAHTDQSLVSGDVMSKIAVYDEKIKTEKDNIDANRKALKQMDEAVDQIMARSTTEGGADKAVAIRRSQQKERSRLVAEIGESQKKISAITEQRAPIAAEVRKVEAEVGPVKYIAAFIYGDNPDENVLEKAVRWVIILIVIVFDPLAVILLLASQYSFEYERKKDEKDEAEEFFDRARDVAQDLDSGTYVAPIVPPMGPITNYTYTTYEPDDGALTDEQVEIIRKMAQDDLPTGNVIAKSSLFPNPEEDFPFRGKGIQPSMPLTASYVQPKDAILEEAEIEEPQVEIDPPEVTITHTKDGIIIEDDAGILEILTGTKPVITDIGGGYVSVDGKVYHHKAWDQLDKIAIDTKKINLMAMDDRLGDYVSTGTDTYVQNEEQKDSDQWTKIVNKSITEEEYLEAVKQQNKKDV
jgi:hypothetical protein